MRIPTPFGPIAAKILMCMFLLHTCLFAQAKADQQNGKQKISIVANGSPLGTVLRQIEKQTGMRFMYAAGVFNPNEKVSINYQQTALDDVLSSLLGGKGIVWQYREENILLKQQSGKSDERSPASNDSESRRNDISGRIMDTNGAPIPGVTIQVKGTNKGTQTDVDGFFNLAGVEPGDVLLITSIGFETREVAIKGDKKILLRLKAVVGILDEAVVIAYGQALKKDIIGNVSTIKGEDIARSPVGNPLLALVGRAPGLDITQRTGFANSGVVTIVQGQNSILRGNDPLFVIDGVPYNAQLPANLGSLQGRSGINLSTNGNALNFINPNDIESVSILKDADATAIYGSRAANGAILITTKKGKQGKTQISLDYQHGAGKVTRKIHLMNTQEYLAMRREAIQNDGGSVQPTDYDINGFWDTTRNTDWQKELLGRTAQYMNVNGSISGGTEAVQYLIGGTFRRETGVVPGNFNDQKGSVHFSLNTSSENKKFRVQFSSSYLVDNNKMPDVDLTYYAITYAPNSPALYKEDGTLNWAQTSSGASTFYNPLAELNRTYDNNTRNLVSNLVLSYAILPGLNVKTSLGYTELRMNEVQTNPNSSWSPDLQPYIPRLGFYGNTTSTSWIVEPQLNYNLSIGAGKLDALLGTSIQRNRNLGNRVSGQGYSSDDVIKDINSATTLTSDGVTNDEYKYAGLFGRLNYNLKERYMINFSARRDGSSRFGPANRYHNFAAVGVGWVFSNEDFVKDNLSFLSFGKVRFSYGTTGNDQIGDYLFLNLYTATPVAVPYRGISGLISNGLTNPYIQWEETKKINFGLDLGVMNNRILLNANYFRNRSSNQLVSYVLPSIAGATSIVANYPATVQNSGLELTLNGTLAQSSKFRWTANINLTIPNNKLIAFKDLQTSSYKNRLIIGQSVSINKVFNYDGVDPTTGAYQFLDSKGNVTFKPDNTLDRQTPVNTSPKWYSGISTSLSYMGITLDVLVQYMSRNGKNYFTGGQYPGAFNTNQPTYLLDRWRKDGDVAPHQRFNADYTIAGNFDKVQNSDLVYADASFARLKNISLSWQLPDRWMKYAGMTNARVYAQGQNLLTFTNYKGLDPETQSNAIMPPLRVFVFGVQLGF